VNEIMGWWFCAPAADGRIHLPHGDGREVVAGETLSVMGPIKACESGLHASERPIDALRYAPGATICRVRLSGDMDRKEDKVAAEHRETLWIADATTALRLFACDCAEAALLAERAAGREPHPASWDAIRVTRLWCSGRATEEEWSVAWSAERSAAWRAARSEAESAAWGAARRAAWSVAWSAAESAARNAAPRRAGGAQNDMLVQRLMDLGPKKGEPQPTGCPACESPEKQGERSPCRVCQGYGWIAGSVGGDPDVMPEPCPACEIEGFTDWMSKREGHTCAPSSPAEKESSDE